MRFFSAAIFAFLATVEAQEEEGYEAPTPLPPPASLPDAAVISSNQSSLIIDLPFPVLSQSGRQRPESRSQSSANRTPLIFAQPGSSQSLGNGTPIFVMPPPQIGSVLLENGGSSSPGQQFVTLVRSGRPPTNPAAGSVRSAARSPLIGLEPSGSGSPTIFEVPPPRLGSVRFARRDNAESGSLLSSEPFFQLPPSRAAAPPDIPITYDLNGKPIYAASGPALNPRRAIPASVEGSGGRGIVQTVTVPVSISSGNQSPTGGVVPASPDRTGGAPVPSSSAGQRSQGVAGRVIPVPLDRPGDEAPNFTRTLTGLGPLPSLSPGGRQSPTRAPATTTSLTLGGSPSPSSANGGDVRRVRPGQMISVGFRSPDIDDIVVREPPPTGQSGSRTPLIQPTARQQPSPGNIVPSSRTPSSGGRVTGGGDSGRAPSGIVPPTARLSPSALTYRPEGLNEGDAGASVPPTARLAPSPGRIAPSSPLTPSTSSRSLPRRGPSRNRISNLVPPTARLLPSPQGESTERSSGAAVPPNARLLPSPGRRTFGSSRIPAASSFPRTITSSQPGRPSGAAVSPTARLRPSPGRRVVSSSPRTTGSITSPGGRQTIGGRSAGLGAAAPPTARLAPSPGTSQPMRPQPQSPERSSGAAIPPSARLLPSVGRVFPSSRTIGSTSRASQSRGGQAGSQSSAAVPSTAQLAPSPRSSLPSQTLPSSSQTTKSQPGSQTSTEKPLTARLTPRPGRARPSIPERRRAPGDLSESLRNRLLELVGGLPSSSGSPRRSEPEQLLTPTYATRPLSSLSTTSAPAAGSNLPENGQRPPPGSPGRRSGSSSRPRQPSTRRPPRTPPAPTRQPSRARPIATESPPQLVTRFPAVFNPNERPEEPDVIPLPRPDEPGEEVIPEDLEPPEVLIADITGRPSSFIAGGEAPGTGTTSLPGSGPDAIPGDTPRPPPPARPLPAGFRSDLVGPAGPDDSGSRDLEETPSAGFPDSNSLEPGRPRPLPSRFRPSEGQTTPDQRPSDSSESRAFAGGPVNVSFVPSPAGPRPAGRPGPSTIGRITPGSGPATPGRTVPGGTSSRFPPGVVRQPGLPSRFQPGISGQGLRSGSPSPSTPTGGTGRTLPDRPRSGPSIPDRPGPEQPRGGTPTTVTDGSEPGPSVSSRSIIPSEQRGETSTPGPRSPSQGARTEPGLPRLRPAPTSGQSPIEPVRGSQPGLPGVPRPSRPARPGQTQPSEIPGGTPGSILPGSPVTEEGVPIEPLNRAGVPGRLTVPSGRSTPLPPLQRPVSPARGGGAPGRVVDLAERGTTQNPMEALAELAHAHRTGDASHGHSVPVDNGVIGDPEIACGPSSLIVSFNTRNPFEGHVFVKGLFNDDTCRVGPTGAADRFASIELPFDSCNVKRQRSLEPRGMFITATVIIKFHHIFITKVDRAVRVQCFYMEADKTVDAELEVSMLTTELRTYLVPMPVCRYDILQGGPQGPPVRFLLIGDQVYHQWTCDTETVDTFCMVVYNCYVDDGTGRDRLTLLDENGCAQDVHLLPNIEYPSDLTAGAEAHVFKYADRPNVYFNCQINIQVKEPNGLCPRPVCPDLGGAGGRVGGNRNLPPFSTRNGQNQRFGRSVGLRDRGEFGTVDVAYPNSILIGDVELTEADIPAVLRQRRDDGSVDGGTMEEVSQELCLSQVGFGILLSFGAIFLVATLTMSTLLCLRKPPGKALPQ